MSEFNLIQQYFTRPTPHADLGVGDDAALVRVSGGNQLVISTDMSVAGTHFLHDCAPYNIGWKALAVNVSDMAAMGAQPKWATLAIALPEVNEPWLAEFSRGFFACADAFNIDLIGGDTTRGPLNICVQILGEVPTGKALRRDGAKLNDDIWVSGSLGMAAYALTILQSEGSGFEHIGHAELENLRGFLEKPQPRVVLGLALRDIATSCIDISDGLLADLGHILQQSQVGAIIHWPKIPRVRLTAGGHEKEIRQKALTGGDDYELCFTAPSNARDAIVAIGQQLNLRLSHIGVITALPELIIYDANNTIITMNKKGFDHFE